LADLSATYLVKNEKKKKWLPHALVKHRANRTGVHSRSEDQPACWQHLGASASPHNASSKHHTASSRLAKMNMGDWIKNSQTISNTQSGKPAPEAGGLMISATH